MPPSHDHTARYDDDGNIIMPSHGQIGEEETLFQESIWTTTENDMDIGESAGSSRLTRHGTPAEEICRSTRRKGRLLLRGILQEGTVQYRWSIRKLKEGARGGIRSLGESAAALWAFLTQPVWIVHAKKQTRKEYSRITLFLLDTVRFGGTFAALFVALFVSLNYQSFWQMSRSYLNPLTSFQTAKTRLAVTQSTLNQKLQRSPALATAGASVGDLFSFLPPVGPPENRLIIPKLGLSVPLVTPSYASLLKEDWSGLEKDIQEALQMGVVHYPGTARPGQAGNFFVTGHSSYYPWAPGKYKSVFARLNELDVGDEYWVYYGGDKFRYIVREKKEVKPTNVNVLDQPLNKRMSTLMTCVPVGTTLRRLIITAEEVDPVTGTALAVGEHHKPVTPALKIESLPI